MEVVGRHALFFDDDANANFVNSKEALVEWNSLFIDRYDVRHLLSSPPASFKRLRPTSGLSPLPDAHLESELDAERYADLPSPSSSDQEPTEMEAGEGTINAGGFHAVSFSYGNTADSNGQKNDDDNNSEGDGFCAPFPVPENLAHGLPSSGKVHQIIARTALFVSQHGSQSEIVLRVKQGDNPTFGFLMPHHHLHPYFRYLVDHPEILSASGDGNPQKGSNTDNQSGSPDTGGALSLLGSVYGSVEDEDEDAKESKLSNDIHSVETTTAGDLTSREQPKKQANSSLKDDSSSKPLHLSKEKASALSKSGSSSIVKSKSANNGKKKDALGSSSADVNDSKLSARSSTVNGELLAIEPPSELKRLVDRIVEIILKNGPGFEALLIEQDKNHGRFPFLLSSNQYHPYYKKTLRMAQSRAIAKSFGTAKDAEKKAGETQHTEESSVQDIPFDYDKKEKFKMVISKSKKEIQEQQASKEPEQPHVAISADEAAAILQAATRGIKKPNLDIIPKISGSGSLGSQHSSQAKDIAKKAAMAAAGEADSSEAGLTKEQKLKAERLKRAKMFAAMIKSRGLSAEPPRTENSDVGPSHKIENSGKCLDDEMDEKALAKKRHYRSSRHEEEDDDETDRHSRKKHHSRHSSRHHSRRHSSSKESRHHRHSHEKDSDDEDDKRHHHHHHKHRHDSSSEDEYERSRHKRRSSEKDTHGDDRRKKHKKRSNSEERGLEEGQIRANASDHSLTSVVDDGNKEKCAVRLSTSTHREERASSEQPQTTVVSDDLRAKIRAMLLATL